MNQPAKPLGVVCALYEAGVSQDDRVGVIGYGFDSFWARLNGWYQVDNRNYYIHLFPEQ